MATINDFTFGVEIEFYLPEGASATGLAAAAGRRLGQPVTVEGYNHHTRPTWKLVTDASLSDSVRGREIVSPILRGEDGFRQLATVCEALSDFGCTVAKTCGFHVHVGARTLTTQHLKNLIKIYQTYESVIDGMMPPSRRGSSNNFCRSLAAVDMARVEQAWDWRDMATAVCRDSLGNASRYTKLNLVAMDRHGTVEFRQHSGTLDARKASMWVKACLRMVVAATKVQPAQAVTTSRPVQQINKAKPGSKSWIIGNMMLRPEGATAPEVLAAVNWPTVSMNAQAKACGLSVITQRRGRVVRYFARRDETQTVQTNGTTFVRTLQGFTTLLEMSADETAYFRTRAENLSGPVAWTA